MDDDGGPSYWWRDKRIKKMQSALGKFDIATAVQNDILNTIVWLNRLASYSSMAS
jgi:hypothetical protein